MMVGFKLVMARKFSMGFIVCLTRIEILGFKARLTRMSSWVSSYDDSYGNIGFQLTCDSYFDYGFQHLD